jgi:hypothetical protein
MRVCRPFFKIALANASGTLQPMIQIWCFTDVHVKST